MLKKALYDQEFHASKKFPCWLKEGRKVTGLDLDNNTLDINMGRSALTSAEENINVYKLLWK